jgi:hypothetical protein
MCFLGLLVLGGIGVFAVVMMLQQQPTGATVVQVTAPESKKERPVSTAKQPTDPGRPVETKPAPEEEPKLTPEGIEQVKKALVTVRANLADGKTAGGVGFFVIEPGVVLTSVQAIGMPKPESPRPTDVQVFRSTDAGVASEARLAGVDHRWGLALLRLDSLGIGRTALPAPLPLAAAEGLKPSSTLHIVGPGEGEGKPAAVTPVNVLGALVGRGRRIDQIELTGGVHAGNLGAPVLDGRGRVIALVLGEGKKDRSKAAAPVEAADALYNGSQAVLTLGDPYRKTGSGVVLPATLQTFDLRNTVRGVSVEVWTDSADAKPGRGPGTDGPTISGATLFKFDTLNNRFRGEIVVPALEAPPGKAYWAQPQFTTATGIYWGTARQFQPEPPIAEPLGYEFTTRKVPAAAQSVELSSQARLKVRSADDRMQLFTTHFDADLTETEMDAKALVKVGKYTHAALLDHQQTARSRLMDKAGMSLATVQMELQSDASGKVTKRTVGAGKAPEDERAVATQLGEQILLGLDALAVPTPGKAVMARDTWKGEAQLPLETTEGLVTLTMRFDVMYQGRQGRDKPEGAVLTFSGVVADGEKAIGTFDGTALYDVASGVIAKARLLAGVQGDVMAQGKAVRVDGTVEIKLQRRAPGT